MNVTIYGIKNCNSVKKALTWLEDKQIPTEFIDFKKQPPTREQIALWCSIFGWERVLNKRGTTYRKLDDSTKTSLTEHNAPDVLLLNTSMIKRPILFSHTHNEWLLGFDEAQYEQLLNK